MGMGLKLDNVHILLIFPQPPNPQAFWSNFVLGIGISDFDQ